MSFTLSTGLMASNYAGSTKKATASGIIFAGWAAGLIAGPRKFDSLRATWQASAELSRILPRPRGARLQLGVQDAQ